MKTFSEFLDEALASFVIKAAARQLFKSKALQKGLSKTLTQAPKKLSFTRLYHGTTKPASQAISKSGWKTDVNVSRQMRGSGIYTTPQELAGRSYASYRSAQRGEQPALRTFSVPTSKVKGALERQTAKYGSNVAKKDFGTDDKEIKFNIVQLSPQSANRYDVTDKPNIRIPKTEKKELRQRVSTALNKPQNVNVLKKELGMSSTSSPSPVLNKTTYRNVGAGRKESVREQLSFEEFIIEASRRAQLASKRGKKPKEGERSRGTDKPSAVVTVGLPGSGKSTIAKHMVSKGNTDQHELDKSRQALGKGPAYFGSDIVQHTYGGAKQSAEQGRSTVLSNTSIPRQHRRDAIDKLKDSGYEKVTPVLSPGSTKSAMRRNRKRTGSKPGERAVPQFVMNRMAQGMKELSRDERKELRSNYKKLHKKERFTKPAMKRSGAIR